MRISTNSMYQKNLQNILNTQSHWQKSGLHLATGKKVLCPSDDPMAASQALVVKQAQARNEQLQATRQSIEKSLARQDTILKEATTIVQNIQETLVYAGNETLNDTDRADLANKLQGFKDQLISLANSRDANGHYIFAGSKNDTPPFIVNEQGQVSYVGSQETLNVFIDETREIPINFTGNNIFLIGSNIKESDDSTSEIDLFASIDQALLALNMELDQGNEADAVAFRDLLAKANKGIDNCFSHISSVRAQGGSLLAEVENLMTLGKTLDIDFQTQISELEDVDWYEAISDYVMLQASLKAAQQTFINMQNMSLFQQK